MSIFDIIGDAISTGLSELDYAINGSICYGDSNKGAHPSETTSSWYPPEVEKEQSILWKDIYKRKEYSDLTVRA